MWVGTVYRFDNCRIDTRSCIDEDPLACAQKQFRIALEWGGAAAGNMLIWLHENETSQLLQYADIAKEVMQDFSFHDLDADAQAELLRLGDAHLAASMQNWDPVDAEELKYQQPFYALHYLCRECDEFYPQKNCVGQWGLTFEHLE